MRYRRRVPVEDDWREWSKAYSIYLCTLISGRVVGEFLPVSSPYPHDKTCCRIHRRTQGCGASSEPINRATHLAHQLGHGAEIANNESVYDHAVRTRSAPHCSLQEDH